MPDVPDIITPHSRTAIFCFVCAGLGCLYGITGATPSGVAALLVIAGPPIAVLMWMLKDARQRRVLNVTDSGLLLYVLLPLAIPWYAFRIRGRSGWSLTLWLYTLAAAGVFGMLVGVIVGAFVFRHPRHAA